MNILKQIVKSFLVGAVVGLVGHILTILAQLIVPADFAVPVAMLAFGIISAIVIASGLYGKIAAFGGDGAAIPLCGLMFGAAAARAEAQAKGASAGKAVLTGFLKIMMVLGAGFVLCFILGLIVKNPGSTTVAPPSIIMQLVWAMLICGAICALTQILTCIKIPFPIVAVILMVVVGGVLTMAGFVPTLLSLGAGGLAATAVGCGNGAYSSGVILALSGVPIPLIISVLLNIVLVLMGSICGGFMKKKQ